MAREATVAQILINDVLPEDLRDYHRVLDKKGLNNLLREVASRYPDRYREISHRLNQLGGKIAFESGGNSPLVEHLQPPEAVKKFKARIEPQLQAVIDNRALSGERRNQQIVDLLSGEMGPLQQAVFQELKEKNNPLARQILSGARGNALQLSSLVAADLLYADNRDRPIPLPVLSSYSQGLSPAEYFAAAYGARKGVLEVKQGTADAGYLTRRLVDAAHDLVITEEDCGTINGIRLGSRITWSSPSIRPGQGATWTSASSGRAERKRSNAFSSNR
jgi:DNA-directed RNA polymerase subunit beta'